QVGKLSDSQDFGEISATVADSLWLVEQRIPAGFYAQHNLVDAGNLFGEWHRVELHMVLGTSPRITVTVDESQVYDGALDPFFTRAPLQVTAGLSYAGAPVGPLVVHIKDVLIQAE